MPNSYTNQWEKEREECVSDDHAKWGERSLVFIQVIEGEVTHPLGFMILHGDVDNQNNLHMCGHKFKNTLLLDQIRWYLYQFWSSRKEEFNAIISIKWVVPRWNLALVANFNNPSQLGRIPPTNPSIIIDHHATLTSCTIFVPHLISALSNTDMNNEEELIKGFFPGIRLIWCPLILACLLHFILCSIYSYCQCDLWLMWLLLETNLEIVIGLLKVRWSNCAKHMTYHC